MSASVTQSAAGTVANAIPAVPGAKIKVTGAVLTVTAAGTVQLQSHTTTGINTAAWSVPTSGLVLPYNPDGWFIASPGEGVDVIFGTGTGLAATFTYEVH